ncbi:MAG TPA: two-component system sensor histidine kinase CreC [Ideonella sp.]|nr:two-component system sensor histidine kinase CreC [Ideonella sp.]
MKLGLRLLLGFFVISGIAAFFVLRVFVLEVRPSVREVMEDMLVDTANILAELARDDLSRMPAGGTLAGSRFARAVKDYASRPVDAKIWGLDKTSLDYRVYVTDARGTVVFDTGFRQQPGATGEDYSRWRDVARTLRGEYGARATRELQTDENSSVMFVAAPVLAADRRTVLGVLTVAKPMSTVTPFIARAERKILQQGVWLLGLSLVVGVLVTGWVIWSVRRLRHYAQHVQFGQREAAPQLSGELGELARAMEAMRERLDGHAHIEQTVRALTHELKSPLTAITGAAELLQDELPAADREAFSGQIQDQASRLRALVERMLELSKLEHQAAPSQRVAVDLAGCADSACRQAAARLAQAGLRVEWQQRAARSVTGDPELLQLALANLLDNAIDFAPRGSVIELSVEPAPQPPCLTLRDHGPGVEDYALPRLGERFFSTPRPAAPGQLPRKGSGLGLAIVKQVMAMHGARACFETAAPGLRVRLLWPA